jgi:hypothetical protein
VTTHAMTLNGPTRFHHTLRHAGRPNASAAQASPM